MRASYVIHWNSSSVLLSSFYRYDIVRNDRLVQDPSPGLDLVTCRHFAANLVPGFSLLFITALDEPNAMRRSLRAKDVL